jgi:NADH dehydrogenase [ubiquinone] 1 alpha subcomplex assembly factor 5
MKIFDRQTVRRHRDRACQTLADHDFLFREVAERLLDRLDDITYKFPTAVDLGSRTGILKEHLSGRGGIETLIQCDLSPAMAHQSGALSLVGDEEFLPFREGSIDLALSCLNLHWVNDLPGALLQIRKALKPDGLFLAAVFGGETLRELRDSFEQGELKIEGGVSPRISPFIRAEDLGKLLQRAGFALPVVDLDTITVSYGEVLKLLGDLRGMGESNAVMERRKNPTRRETLMAAIAHYLETYGDDDGRVPATFQVLFITAWAPAPTQQQPALRGAPAPHMGDLISKFKPEEDI